MEQRFRAVLFDVFGTTVNAQDSLVQTAERLGAERGLRADWAGLAKAWYQKNQSTLKPVVEKKRPWTGQDKLQREALDSLVGTFGAKKLSSADRDLLTFGWHFLTPWPDAVPALHRLKKHFILGAFSNGTVRELIDIAKFAGLPWDVVIGADLFRTYKPDPKMYTGAAALLQLRPEQILLVAAHNNDLQAAAKQGMRTCFVRRSTEDAKSMGSYDYVVDNFEDLARSLNAV